MGVTKKICAATNSRKNYKKKYKKKPGGELIYKNFGVNGIGNFGSHANSGDFSWKKATKIAIIMQVFRPFVRIKMNFCGFFQGMSSEFAWLSQNPYTMHPVKKSSLFSPSPKYLSSQRTWL